ncbi:hypothetical protein [Mycolicibacterium gilvum]|uniref:Secreted protein n=2 Tax=Mycolicibacterium gilvum TaxID=1804 RepID=E6TDC6_MYCSR|nr:hypothetical protein [Mycolicibacterium gilvum]ABP47387.1 conserved hypothetical protein [Mycolicibacterium gilvum PYR-GCK]ADU00895.1 hypothetical protein Mspyr1_43380 [Mycolicibacterium gilvum Spyr1]
MAQPRLPHAAAGLVAVTAAVSFGPPAGAEPVNPIPGNGIFLVGQDIAPGLYRTDGTASVFGVWINDVPTQDSMCLWFTYSTPDTNKDNVVATNMSIGPMYANINATVKAFESRNCAPWARVT